jgi:hypothetical protein
VGRFFNQTFQVPMLAQEVLSISRWTSRHMSAEGLRAWGEPGRQRSLQVRQTKAADKAETIRAYKQEHQDMSNRALARELKVSHFTVNEALKNKN